MKREGFALRQRTSVFKKLPEDFDMMVEYQRFLIRLRQQHCCMMGHMGKSDYTPIWYDMPLNQTVTTKRSKQVKLLTTGNDHSQFTVMLACTCQWKEKLAPNIIFKRKNKRKGLPKEAFPRDVIVRVNKTK